MSFLDQMVEASGIAGDAENEIQRKYPKAWWFMQLVGMVYVGVLEGIALSFFVCWYFGRIH